MKKYELTNEVVCENGRDLHRIRALMAFGCVKVGDKGGFVEFEKNLSHSGNAWVYGDARVCGDAEVYGDAWVCGNAWVCGDAHYATAKGFGSEFRNTTFFRLKDGGIGVRCGCFQGTLAQFRERVRGTYPEGKKGKEYLMLADLMEYRFGGEENESSS